ncbi:hypothetical protein FPE28_003603 [Salmonella bongori]|uniref:Uncharacterized protein n=1 Tax=Salmonella bongori TaxID=54736 RepID=A0A698W2U5_SALBN|nr:hypothetical protein [Salmonella bongori]EDP8629668.1 hypothetical protein [Salmonella bongori]
MTHSGMRESTGRPGLSRRPPEKINQGSSLLRSSATLTSIGNSHILYG